MTIVKTGLAITIAALMGSLAVPASAQQTNGFRERLRDYGQNLRDRYQQARERTERRDDYQVNNGRNWTMRYKKIIQQPGTGQYIGACYTTGDAGSEGVVAFSQNGFGIVVPFSAMGLMEEVARYGSTGSRYGDLQTEQEYGYRGKLSERFERDQRGPRQNVIWVAPTQAGYTVYSNQGSPATDDQIAGMYRQVRFVAAQCNGPR